MPKNTKATEPEQAPPVARRKSWVERDIETPLTNEEKTKLSKQLVEALEALEDAEERKGEVAAQFSGEIKTHKATYKSIVRAIRRGHVMRTVRCPVRFNKPKEGFKQIVNPDGDKVLETMAMSEFEKQENLFAEMEAPPESGKPNDAKVDESKPELVGSGKAN